MKYVALDIGNVLTYVDFSKFYYTMKYYYNNIGDDVISNFIDSIQGWQNLGLLSIGDCLKLTFLKNTDIYKLNIIEDAWNLALRPSPTMMNFVADLKESGVKVALLSNIGPEHAYYFRYLCPNLIKNCIEHFSCEVGAMKPHKLFYQSFLLDHKEFNKCVYLDDRMENIYAGNKYKFNSIYFNLNNYKNDNDLKQELKRIKKIIKK